jgi:hypothetical protein
MAKIPDLTKGLADEIAKTAKVQLRTSRQYKMQRMKDIGESEDLYYGIVKKQARNPFNESFPFMSGFIDGLMGKLDDMPQIEFSHTDEADYNSARKYQALFDQEVSSVLPEASWAKKDRWCRNMALFSGVGVYCLYGESYEGKFKLHFDIKDFYDFHCEPGGGGDLEQHLFCGEESIFKTRDQLLDGVSEGYYDEGQVMELLTKGGSSDYKQNDDIDNQRLNRHRAMGLDPQTNNYVGEDVYKFVQWYLHYKGIRWYCLFEENTGAWIRVKALQEMFPATKHTGDALYPYVVWHTHENARVFWSKAPADDARPIARNVNRLLNQELYNREKKNNGQRAYDPEMYHDLESLMDNRPDGLTPFDSKGGTRQASQGIYTFQVGDLGGTLDLVSYLDGYASQKTGTQSKTQTEKPADQKVGVFFGELKQIEERVGIYNRSFREAWAQLGYRFIQAVDDHVTQPIAVQMLGADGLEWGEFTAQDKQRNRDFNIRIKGGNAELQESLAKDARKQSALGLLQTVNPRWKDTEAMKTAGYTDDEMKDAFSMLNPASKELISEACKAVDDISRGRPVKLNYSANLAYIQKLVDMAQELNDQMIQGQIYDLVIAHGEIVAENEARSAVQMIQNKRLETFNKNPLAPGGGAPVMGNEAKPEKESLMV